MIRIEAIAGIAERNSLGKTTAWSANVEHGKLTIATQLPEAEQTIFRTSSLLAFNVIEVKEIFERESTVISNL